MLGRIDIADFSPHAAEAARWTRDQRRATRRWTSSAALDAQRDGEAIGLWHASPRDPVWEYVLSIPQAEDCIDEMGPRVGAIGHTHVACRFTRTQTDMVGEGVVGRHELDLSEGEWLLNPGSVGQPRDGDPRAAWLLLDTRAAGPPTGGGWSTRSTRPRGRSPPPGCRAASASGST